MRALLAGYIGASAQGQNPIQRRGRTGRAGSQCLSAGRTVPIGFASCPPPDVECFEAAIGMLINAIAKAML